MGLTPQRGADGWLRFAFILSIIIAMAALMLFLLVSVFFVPGILKWGAAQPWVFLGLYLFLFGLTTVPFFAARHFSRYVYGTVPDRPRAAPLFGFAGLLAIPALILLPQVGSAPHILDRTADMVVLGGPGVLCVMLSILLTHRGIAILRSNR